MNDLWTALALVLVIEGLLYAAFPDPMRRMVVAILAVSVATLRIAGLVTAGVGLLAVWLLRG